MAAACGENPLGRSLQTINDASGLSFTLTTTVCVCGAGGDVWAQAERAIEAVEIVRAKMAVLRVINGRLHLLLAGLNAGGAAAGSRAVCGGLGVLLGVMGHDCSQRGLRRIGGVGR